MESALGLPAPAKLNLFLHVTGRRADGYHTLQTAFQLIDLADWLDFERRDDGQIVREGDLRWDAGDDLAVRAALALRQATGCRLGASIRVTKNIPAGSGMGGGSSDAATTLIALNRLWGLGLSRPDLARDRAAAGCGRAVLPARHQRVRRRRWRGIARRRHPARVVCGDLASSACFHSGNLRGPRFDTKYQTHENSGLFCCSRAPSADTFWRQRPGTGRAASFPRDRTGPSALAAPRAGANDGIRVGSLRADGVVGRSAKRGGRVHAPMAALGSARIERTPARGLVRRRRVRSRQ